MKLIVAVDEQWGIGKKGDLLLSIPDDMRFFREKTKRAILVMGYNTLLSFPGSKPLPGRLNIVLNDAEGVRAPGTMICKSIDQLFSAIRDFNSDDIFVIGGGSIYRQLLPYCDTAYITKMRFNGEADTFIPDLDKLSEWELVSESETKEYNGISYSFAEYRNSSPSEVGFTGSDIKVAEAFEVQKDVHFPFFDNPDISYKDSLMTLLRAYFHPLSKGLTSSELAMVLKHGGNAYDCMRYYECIYEIGDFILLDEKFDNTDRYCVAFVTRERLKEFEEALYTGADEVREKFDYDKYFDFDRYK